ncbi:MAG: thermonuclease family protein [Gemmataceae bacterium]
MKAKVTKRQAAESPPRYWRRAVTFMTLLVLGLFRTTSVQGQTVYYAEQPSFLIPVYPDPNDKKTQALILHVSEDLGKTYQYVATAGILQKTFSYRAPRDGWYWFSVQTQETGGVLKPASMAGAPALLKVCVDTLAPSIILRQAPATKDGTLGVEWEVRDENLDVSSMRLEYRLLGGKDWVPLPAQQLQQGSHAWNPGTPSPLEVRLSVRDRDKNLGEQVLALGLKPGQVAPTNSDGRVPLIMVRSKRFALNYRLEDVGPSDVTRVEVHYTRDGGRTWGKYPMDAPKDPPCILEVPEEGRYGFTLIARSGVDLSESPPKPGDAPHVWVEVDETKPSVRIVGVEVGRGPEQGNMTINWSATDKFLGSSPIAISYAQTPEGPWTEAVKDLPNNGKFVWKMPAQGLPYQFSVRVTCTDMAGNQGMDQTSGPVKVDLNTPKARINSIEIAPVEGAAPAPPGLNPAAPASAPPAPPAMTNPSPMPPSGAPPPLPMSQPAPPPATGPPPAPAAASTDPPPSPSGTTGVLPLPPSPPAAGGESVSGPTPGSPTSLGAGQANTRTATDSHTHQWKCVGVHDGDTVTCLNENNEQQKIRLAEIDAPELKQDFGQRSREALAAMVFGKTITVVDQNKDRYGRWIGRLYADGIDVNRQMVATGYAWHYASYSKDPSLGVLMQQAKDQKLGLWGQGDPIPPWDYRKKKTTGSAPVED